MLEHEVVLIAVVSSHEGVIIIHELVLVQLGITTVIVVTFPVICGELLLEQVFVNKFIAL
jgi:hypothetical protein